MAVHPGLIVPLPAVNSIGFWGQQFVPMRPLLGKRCTVTVYLRILRQLFAVRARLLRLFAAGKIITQRRLKPLLLGSSLLLGILWSTRVPAIIGWFGIQLNCLPFNWL